MASSVSSGSLYGTGVYGTDVYGVSNVTITVDGVTSSGAVTTTAISGNSTLTVTGVSATAQLGVPNVVAGTVATPDDDVPMVGSVGTVAVVANSSVTVTGVSATTTVNDLPTPDSVYDVVGVQGTTQLNGDYTDLHTGFYVYGNTTNAIYGEGVYGTSRYGFVDPNVFHEVSSVDATGAVGSVSIAAGSDVSLNIFVSAQVITDAPGIVGDEVTVTADAVVEPTGVAATGAAGDLLTQTENVFVVSSVEATGAVGDTVVEADANTAITGVSATATLDDVAITADSNVSVTGVAGITSLDTGFIVRNNARPTFTGVSAVGGVGTTTVTTTTNIFQAADRNARRQVYVLKEKPRVVHIPQDRPRKVYVEAA